MTSIGIIGSEGRMGVALSAAISEAGERSCGIDKGGNVAKLAAAADVLVDFSSPGALEATLDACIAAKTPIVIGTTRSEEHTSELQSLMRISYAVFCLKTKNNTS